MGTGLAGFALLCWDCFAKSILWLHWLGVVYCFCKEKVSQVCVLACWYPVVNSTCQIIGRTNERRENKIYDVDANDGIQYCVGENLGQVSRASVVERM